ncbi:MAG: glycosyltransferase family 2 protein [Planctomycetales bacterium]|nr:glycosyltransferase family 2 protein [Planctomycetales bacterium]
MPRFLTVLPVYNESQHIAPVLDQVSRHASDVLVVDDGSDDGSSELLRRRSDIDVVFHPQNRGYGAALLTAFDYAIVHRYDVVVTIDCDGQHEPQRIAQLVAGCECADIVSGSRYLDQHAPASQAPADRRKINQQVTAELNRRLGLDLTDAFCGFKAYRTQSLAQLDLTETGYAMPLELWVQAAWHQLQILEVSVPLIYLDQDRSFGGALDSASTRMNYYREVIDRAIRACCEKPALLEAGGRLCAVPAWPCR